jgi:PhoH-like ATPase
MARKNTQSAQADIAAAKDAPQTLKDHPYYGLRLDEYQEAFRDAIWNPDIRFISVDAVAGSGKTTIAIATACLLYAYGLVDGCIYCRTPASEGRIGFLPGDQASKERPYMQPLYNTLCNIGENPYTAIDTSSNMENRKYQTGYWQAITDVYLLGDDFKNKAVVIDEAQCMTTDQLRTIITRCHDSCKVMVIGSTLQIQGIAKEESGFTHCIEHFEDRPWAKHCVLVNNYRGEMSAWADKL